VTEAGGIRSLGATRDLERKRPTIMYNSARWAVSTGQGSETLSVNPWSICSGDGDESDGR
jgi:hypothetical protein